MTSAPDTRSRFSRRAWRRRLLTARPYLIGAGVVAALAVVGWVVFVSSLLAADTVEVEGEQTIAAQDVLAAADVDLGTPLVRLDVEGIRDRVAALPAVAAVEVHRDWPGTVVIDITERTPLVAIHHQGSWWVMDGEGVIFRKTGTRDKALPVVQLPAGSDDDARREVVSVATALPPDLLGQLRRITARSMDSITLRLKDKSEVRWGSGAESERKVEVLALLLDKVKASVYDVSVPEQPTTSR